MLPAAVVIKTLQEDPTAMNETADGWRNARRWMIAGVDRLAAIAVVYILITIGQVERFWNGI